MMVADGGLYVVAGFTGYGGVGGGATDGRYALVGAQVEDQVGGLGDGFVGDRVGLGES